MKTKLHKINNNVNKTQKISFSKGEWASCPEQWASLPEKWAT